MASEHQSNVDLLMSWAQDDPLFAAIEWDIVYAFLVAVACEQLRYCRPDDVVCGIGETPRDFAWETCLLMLQHTLGGSDCPTTTPAMCGFLREVMCHDIVDRIRVRKGKGKVKLDFEQAVDPEREPRSDAPDPMHLAMTREGDGTMQRFLTDLREYPDPHPLFPRYVRLMLRDPGLPPRKAAAALGISVREVNEMLRRLKRRMRRFWCEEAIAGRTHSPRRRKRSNSP